MYDYHQPIADVEPDYGDRGAGFRRFLSQVGLTVKRSQGPVETFVVDSASKPSAN